MARLTAAAPSETRTLLCRGRLAKGRIPPIGATVGYEVPLLQLADALRGCMGATEYKHVVFGVILLEFISDAFEGQHAKLEAER
jgi:hypothetical protein